MVLIYAFIFKNKWEVTKTHIGGSETYVSLAHVSVSRSGMFDFATPCTIAGQAPLSVEFSRKENWSE